MKHPPGIVKPHLKNRILLRREQLSPTACYNSIFISVSKNLYLNMSCQSTSDFFFLSDIELFLSTVMRSYLSSVCTSYMATLDSVLRDWINHVRDQVPQQFKFNKINVFKIFIIKKNKITVTLAIRQLYFDK